MASIFRRGKNATILKIIYIYQRGKRNQGSDFLLQMYYYGEMYRDTQCKIFRKKRLKTPKG
jgi:hypothetical protein